MSPLGYPSGSTRGVFAFALCCCQLVLSAGTELTEARTSFSVSISFSMSSLRCMRARAYSLGSPGYASGSGSGSWTSW